MSAGSDASNMGYGNKTYFENINGNFVDKNAYNGGAFFSDNTIPGNPPGPLPGYSGTKINTLAAAGFYGGSSRKAKKHIKIIKNKIKNITKHYKKMKAGSKKTRQIKKLIKKRLLSRRLARSFARRGGYSMIARKKSRKMNRKMRGGYAQYEGNLPLTPTYQVAGINLPSNQLALANPPPIKVLSNCTNCVDNYNHFTNKGFPSEGH